jgi:predicted nucleic acid-binding protein
MKLVLDASVALKWVLPEADSDRAIALQTNYETGVHDLIAPDTFPVEVAHSLARAERRGLIHPPEALLRFQQLALTLPRLHSYLAVLPRALEIASQARIGVYDCLYVALAEREGCPLVTADQRLVNTFEGQFSVVPLAALA